MKYFEYNFKKVIYFCEGKAEYSAAIIPFFSVTSFRNHSNMVIVCSVIIGSKLFTMFLIIFSLDVVLTMIDWLIDWLNEWMNKRTDERTNKRTIEWMIDWMIYSGFLDE